MPSLSLDALHNSLQRGLMPLYVIHGEETLLALEAADTIRHAARSAGYLEREVLQVEGNYDWSHLKEAMSSVSLFASLKLLEIRIPNGKPGVEGGEALKQLADNPPEDTIALILLPKLERAQQQGKWFSALAKSGQIIEARPITRHELPNWIRQRLSQQQQSLDDTTLTFFADRVEGNLLAARQEINKLALLYPPGELTLDQVRSAVANVARFDVFDLAEAWMGGEQERLSRMLEGLEAEGETPVLLLWALAEDLRMLLHLRHGLASGRQTRDMARELRLWGKKQSLAEPALRRIGVRRLTTSLENCACIDRQIKGAESGDPWLTLRTLLQNLAA